MSEFPKEDAKREFIISDNDKALVDSLFSTLEDAKLRSVIPRHIELSHLSQVLDNEQLYLIERVYAIDPATYGFRGEYVGIEAPPKNFKHIDAQPFIENGEPATTKPQDLPIATFDAFSAMAEAMRKDINRPLLITDGYRTSAEQALTFLAYLRLYEYDVPRMAKRVAVPGYSEHGAPSSLALDLQNIDGLPSDENPIDFKDTLEYSWLLKNANRFDFYLSYPENNSQGMMFEPWHWRHVPSKNR